MVTSKSHPLINNTLSITYELKLYTKLEYKIIIKNCCITKAIPWPPPPWARSTDSLGTFCRAACVSNGNAVYRPWETGCCAARKRNSRARTCPARTICNRLRALVAAGTACQSTGWSERHSNVAVGCGESTRWHLLCSCRPSHRRRWSRGARWLSSWCIPCSNCTDSAAAGVRLWCTPCQFPAVCRTWSHCSARTGDHRAACGEPQVWP